MMLMVKHEQIWQKGYFNFFLRRPAAHQIVWTNQCKLIRDRKKKLEEGCIRRGKKGIKKERMEGRRKKSGSS